MSSRPGRKPIHYSQVARVSSMIRRLIGGATVGDLAEEFHVTKRQVHRDLRHLEESGYPLVQEDGRWRLPPGFKGLEIVVSPYELMSLYFAKSHLDYLKDSGLKILVQHLYPGRSRSQGVAHGTVSTIEPHGA